jgi:hypothetical protein
LRQAAAPKNRKTENRPLKTKKKTFYIIALAEPVAMFSYKQDTSRLTW